jgi:hypothetical protein
VEKHEEAVLSILHKMVTVGENMDRGLLACSLSLSDNAS